MSSSEFLLPNSKYPKHRRKVKKIGWYLGSPKNFSQVNYKDSHPKQRNNNKYLQRLLRWTHWCSVYQRNLSRSSSTQSWKSICTRTWQTRMSLRPPKLWSSCNKRNSKSSSSLKPQMRTCFRKDSVRASKACLTRPERASSTCHLSPHLKDRLKMIQNPHHRGLLSKA
jgi:hypothetical protein